MSHALQAVLEKPRGEFWLTKELKAAEEREELFQASSGRLGKKSGMGLAS